MCECVSDLLCECCEAHVPCHIANRPTTSCHMSMLTEHFTPSPVSLLVPVQFFLSLFSLFHKHHSAFFDLYFLSTFPSLFLSVTQSLAFFSLCQLLSVSIYPSLYLSTSLPLTVSLCSSLHLFASLPLSLDFSVSCHPTSLIPLTASLGFPLRLSVSLCTSLNLSA